MLDRARNLNYVAHLATCCGQLDVAENAARACLDLYRPLAAERDERLATYIFMLATVLATAGKFEEAVALGEEAVTIFATNHTDRD